MRDLAAQRFLLLRILSVATRDCLERFLSLGQLAPRFLFGALGFLDFLLRLFELRVCLLQLAVQRILLFRDRVELAARFFQLGLQLIHLVLQFLGRLFDDGLAGG